MEKRKVILELDSLSRALQQFDRKHQRPAMGNLTDLLVTLELENGMWPSYWSDDGILRKYAEEPCVYTFFDHEGKILYIGQTQCLGKRFGWHFSKNRIGKEQTGAIAFIPVPRNCWFEILAIEAYLIDKLQPPANKT